MEKISEAYERLDELLRKVDSLISPITAHHTIQWLQDPNAKQALFEKHPKCFLKLGMGEKHTLFPICNRGGNEDPDMIRFSLKLANRMNTTMSLEPAQHDELNVIISRLKRLESKLSADIPKPDSMSILKARSTKQFKQNMK